jgi:hypothetical protein
MFDVHHDKVSERKKSVKRLPWNFATRFDCSVQLVGLAPLKKFPRELFAQCRFSA